MRWVLVVVLLAGCSSPPTKVPEDASLARLNHAGEIAYVQEHPDQAADEYRQALERARARDDAGAIADAGFNLATAQLRANLPRDAMRTARDLKAELARRGIADPGFDLIAAVALFRLNDLPGADRDAATLTHAKDPAVANAAWFLRGLIADVRGDTATLQVAAASLTTTAEPADVAELHARVTHDPAQALSAADLRRGQLDYRGMDRALVLAAQYTRDRSSAADLYLRAGHSAAAQGDTADARDWLEKAHEMTSDVDIRHDAEVSLHALATR